MPLQSILFEKILQQIDNFFKFTGLHLDINDTDRTLIQRLKSHLVYTANVFGLNILVLGEIAWFVNGILQEKSIAEITYVFPCFTMSFLGDCKTFYIILYAHHVNEIVATLRDLHVKDHRMGIVRLEVEEELKSLRLPMLKAAIYILAFTYVLVCVTFGFSCIYVIVKTYLETGQIQLVYPFLILYPFNEYDKRVFPFLFVHQVWAAIFTAFSVFGPDCFYYTAATFIHIEFRSLHYDMSRVVEGRILSQPRPYDAWKQKLVPLVERHKDLIRCVDLMEIIFSRSTLLNVVSSSFILCLAAFNVMSGKDIVATMSYIVFFVMGFIQIFALCYYGDLLTESSEQIGDAVYSSEWYKADAAMRRYLLLILVRSQKPCTLTAWMFSDINLRAFARILSASWSYLMLLISVNE